MYGRVLERADVLLLQVLLRDSRASAAQIAEVTGLPAQAIPGMVARMREAGIIGDMTTKPSLLSLNARSVLVLGRSGLSSLQGLRMALERNENVAWMAIATGGMAYVALHLREGADLEREVRRVASEAMMAQPKAMTRELFDHGRGGHAYTKDDMRILRALYRDSNKDLEQVAKETGVAVRKVRERFDLMAMKGALDFSVDFFPDNCDNLLAMLRLEVLDPRGLEEKVGWLMGANAPYVMFFNAFPDTPGTLTSMVIPESMGGLRAVLRSFEESGAFGHVATDLLLGSTIRDTWRDRALRGPE
ncbi:MAG TPA: winged helix-turn-helix transcriptional regulator [Methanomassiliicoccales archaeon]|nr:winged helix-turn-helix transcriptional regulator [Methanomassiliicoccales archaeon]